MPEPDVLNCRLFVPYFSLNWLLQPALRVMQLLYKAPLLAQRNPQILMNAG